MSRFKDWMHEHVNPELLRDIQIIRKDPRFVNYDNDQIELMLLHHSVEEILKYGPEETLNRYNDLAIKDAIDVGDVF